MYIMPLFKVCKGNVVKWFAKRDLLPNWLAGDLIVVNMPRESIA